MCLSVCFCVLPLIWESTQIGIKSWIPMESVGYGDHFTKGGFSKKCVVQKLWRHLHTATTSMATSPYTKEANKLLSSTISRRNTSQCQRQQATFSFKPIFLYLSYSCSPRVLSPCLTASNYCEQGCTRAFER